MIEKSLPTTKNKKRSDKVETLNSVQKVKEDLLSRGIKLFEEGDYIKSVEIFSRKLGADNDNIARQYLVRCYFKLQSAEKARDYLEQLETSDDPKMVTYALSMLAVLEADQGNVNAAIAKLKNCQWTLRICLI